MAADWQSHGSAHTNRALFDVLERRFVLGIKYEL